MDYKHYNYIINERTQEDIQNYNKKDIKKNFEDLDYLKTFLKKFAIKNNEQIHRHLNYMEYFIMNLEIKK